MQPKLLVIGSLNMDLVVRVTTQPRPGDTVLGSDSETIPGGKGANQAAAAARAGGRVSMLGLVGDDAFGDILRANLERSGVDVATVATVEGSSGLALITVDAAGQNMIVVSPGANGKLTPERFEEEMLGGVAVVVMQLEIPLETVLRVAERAHAKGVRVVLNPAPARALPETLLSQLDTFIVNEGEAAAVSGISVTDAETATAAAKALQAQGVQTVIVTLGGQGLVWVGDATEGYLPAHKVEVVDTTAAGDAFCGAYAAKLAEGCGLEEALRFANAAGALTVTKRGAQPSLPTAAEIQAFLQNL